jgi:hypothetical protein
VSGVDRRTGDEERPSSQSLVKPPKEIHRKTPRQRRAQRDYRVSVLGGRHHPLRGTATVYVVDGYGRAVSDVAHVVGARTELDAIEAVLAERLLVSE